MKSNGKSYRSRSAAQKLEAVLEASSLSDVVASFSRPRVSDDNPFSEALFRTMKYRPGYPSQPFASFEDAIYFG